MPRRSRLLTHKLAKEEHELHIVTNPFLNPQSSIHDDDGGDDYQAPLTVKTLKPNSKWILVRNNIHKIRSWGGIQQADVNDPFRDWYLFFQMRRELRRVKEHIRKVEDRPDFAPVRYFYLPTTERRARRYNVTHIQPTDALYYPGFGREPFVLQSLLYYFSRECVVPYNSVFRPFLSDVCSIIDRDQQRLNRAAVFRKIALIMAIIIFIIIGLMLFTLILSVITTASNFRKLYENDSTGGIEWQTQETTVNSF
jgi:hypothetical protein